MHTNRVNVFHVTNRNTVSCRITHYLILNLFPSGDAALNQTLSDTAQTKTIGADIVQFFFVMCDTAAASAKGICRADNNRITDFIGKRNRIIHMFHDNTCSNRLVDFFHRLFKFQTVFCLLNCF